MNLLFVCSENRLRSPTGEEVFSHYEGVNAIGCGTNKDAATPVSGDLIEWADIIFVMENTHKNKVSKKFKEAVKDATDAHGLNDGDETPAAFVYIEGSNENLVLERTGIQNGGFEDNLKYWEQNGGDIRILSKLSTLSTQEGSYMAILSSGLGSVSDSDAIITQQFKVPADADFLTFNYDVVSEEPMEYVGSEYDDKFRAVLIDEDGNEIQLAYETVNTSSWTAISGSQSDGGMFDGGDETAFHTGWKSVNHPISSLVGQTVTLKFRAWDVGDSAYDTAALIDNISLH